MQTPDPVALHSTTTLAGSYTGLLEQFKLNSLLELLFLTQCIFCPARKAPNNINDKQSECSTQIPVYNIKHWKERNEAPLLDLQRVKTVLSYKKRKAC